MVSVRLEYVDFRLSYQKKKTLKSLTDKGRCVVVRHRIFYALFRLAGSCAPSERMLSLLRFKPIRLYSFYAGKVPKDAVKFARINIPILVPSFYFYSNKVWPPTPHIKSRRISKAVTKNGSFNHRLRPSLGRQM